MSVPIEFASDEWKRRKEEALSWKSGWANQRNLLLASSSPVSFDNEEDEHVWQLLGSHDNEKQGSRSSGNASKMRNRKQCERPRKRRNGKHQNAPEPLLLLDARNDDNNEPTVRSSQLNAFDALLPESERAVVDQRKDVRLEKDPIEPGTFNDDDDDDDIEINDLAPKHDVVERRRRELDANELMLMLERQLHERKHARGAYVFGATMAVDEDEETEFKSIENAGEPSLRIADYSGKYVNAFLNSASGGTIYFGVMDDGMVIGVPLDRQQRDRIRLRVDAAVSGMRPQVDPMLCRMRFVPIEMPTRASKQHYHEYERAVREVRKNVRRMVDERSKRRYVVELIVFPGARAPVYFTSSGAAYIRRASSVHKMSADVIGERQRHGRPTLAHRDDDHDCASSSSSSSSLRSSMPSSSSASPFLSSSSSASFVPPDFIGRHREIDTIRHYVFDAADATARRVSTVLLYGKPLVGKSALAKRLVIEFGSQFPDRHVVIDLKGVTQPYVSETEARVGLIRQYYPNARLRRPRNADDDAELRGLYESIFADLRCILLIENAGHAQQVLSLRPTSSRSCLVLVTSRRDLHLDAVGDGLCVGINPLQLGDARTLLANSVGVDVPPLADQDADRLLELCAGRPLLIRIIGATLRRGTLSAAELIGMLSDRDAKYAFFSSSMSFDESLRGLGPRIVELLLPLGVFRGTFSLDAAIAIWGAHPPGSDDNGADDDNDYDDDAQDCQLSCVDVSIGARRRVASERLRARLMANARAAIAELLDAAVIERRGEQRYVIADVIQVHLYRTGKVERPSELAEWRRRFMQHFLDVIHRLKHLYFDREQCANAPSIFLADQHNFEAGLSFAASHADVHLAASFRSAVKWFARTQLEPAEQQRWLCLPKSMTKRLSTSSTSNGGNDLSESKDQAAVSLSSSPSSSLASSSSVSNVDVSAIK
jgi:Schlafen, AlbA_2